MMCRTNNGAKASTIPFSVVEQPISVAEILDLGLLSNIVRSMAGIHGVSIIVSDARQALVREDTLSLEHNENAIRCSQRLVCAGESVGEICLLSAKASPGLESLCTHLVEIVEALIVAAFTNQLSELLHRREYLELDIAFADKAQKLHVAKSRLDELEGLKSNFLATVSHELRTPLTSVIGYADMLAAGMAGELNEEQQGFVQTVLSKSDQLLSLITGILDVSMLEAKTLRLNPEKLSLPSLIGSVAKTFSNDLSAKSITLHLPKERIPLGMGDRPKVKQVILHLLANAIKFSPSGGEINIDVRIGALSNTDTATASSPFWRGRLAERFGLRVTVQDQGVGIPVDKRQAIFAPFVQVDSGPTRAYGGPGLGLSLAHSYVSAHGGCLWVENAPEGAGSRFTFSLPAVAEELEAFVWPK